MGIPGLINAIGSGERISLSKLAIIHLERTSRPIRIAVDISIWLFQVQAGRGGRNPELRTLFYRLLKFLALPIHPLFVYDGKDKPPFKRGKAVSGRSYGNAPIIRLSKVLIDLFKFPRHDAPGEAEAECARLQRAGVVDAVMSNDVDALMFGSTLTVMNFSKESGSGTSAATHITCYRMCGDSDHPSNVPLDRAGMILFAMLSGGDYLPSGVPKCGSKLAAEIARAGFGADLLDTIRSDGPELDMKLDEWRERLQYELDENESGYFQTKHKAVRIPESFPDRTILSYYAKPVVSSPQDIEVLKSRLMNAWDQEIDVLELRRFTADAFEWNYRSGARKVIKLLAEPLVSYRLRLQKSPSPFARNTSLSDSNVQMLQKIYKCRTSFSTDGLTELQLEIVPIDVVGLDLLAEEPNPPITSQETTIVSGDEEEDVEVYTEATVQSPTKKRTGKRFDPYAAEKVWIFETIATIGVPAVVQTWKKEQAEKSSASKKSSNRKTGPKKKGPIDPGMKRGSILKYGTLTKQRSDISEFKGAQLIEAAMSATPRKSRAPGLLRAESSPDALMRGSPAYVSPAYGPYSHKRMLDIQPHVNQTVDDLVDSFTSSCTISSMPDIKRHPMATRSLMGSRRAGVRSGDVEVQTLDFLSPETVFNSSPSRVSSARIKISYSNVRYDDSTGSDLSLDSNSAVSPPSAGRESRRYMQSRPIKTSAKRRSGVEIQELEDIMSAVTLSDGSPYQQLESLAQTPTSLKARSLKGLKMHEVHALAAEAQTVHASRTKESASPAANHSCAKGPNVRLPPSAQKTLVMDLCADDALKQTTEKEKRVESSSKVSRPRKTSSHLESVIVCDGFWTTEAKSQSELASEETERGSFNSDEKRKKKRIPRVSILDLS
ncbi:flap endonuclease GEN homolog 1 [Aspergillus udagawae]|uniref:Flap endonuclease GEN homolog 1 n=1 Tax=Aspergillus udagawae TaxID=91492 RepID=A0ABQ1AZA8_9EURO|nr:flap endonuclease GEN homolog 1 [Aspergillus udagawae]